MIDKNSLVEYKVVSAAPRAIVVHCSDPRFQVAFRSFIQEDLKYKEGEYISIVVPGGISALSEPEAFPKNFKVLKEQIELFLEHVPTVKKVVLINHEDCKGYQSLQSKIGAAFLKFAGSVLERQKIDLGKVTKLLLSFASFKVDIQTFYAKFKDDKHDVIVFEEVKLK